LSLSPTNCTIVTPKSPSPGRSPSIVPSISSSYNSATLPTPRKIREPASLPTSIDFLHLSKITKRDESTSSPNRTTAGQVASQPSSSTSNVCEICSMYGHPWIEICNAIRATKGQ
ncbi:GSCOCG00008294001-RA-CDS, partial [Cotesia congregata]